MYFSHNVSNFPPFELMSELSFLMHGLGLIYEYI